MLIMLLIAIPLIDVKVTTTGQAKSPIKDFKYNEKGLLQKLNRFLNSPFEYFHILFFITLKCVCNQ
jgi:hypothetical protein